MSVNSQGNHNPVTSMFRNFNETSKTLIKGATPFIRGAAITSGVALFVLACLASAGVLSSASFGACAIALGTVALMGIGQALYNAKQLGIINTLILAVFEGSLITRGAMAIANPAISASLITVSIIVGVVASTLAC